jgi:thymidylate synthase-like protein
LSIRHIEAKSVGDALHQGLHHLIGFGVPEPSRNGDVIVSPMPVVTTYARPLNRVLVNPLRDANPFFHLFESLWMLAGRNDLAFPQKFVSTFGQFSDDGETLHGAYGFRWRESFGFDQLSVIVAELIANPKTRRCVLAMWNADCEGAADLQRAIGGGKDVPCNVTATFDTIGDVLNLNVFCRSNDAVLGAAGANAVHFSFLLEYMALMTGIPMGVYRQFSMNYHVYTDLYPNLKLETVKQVAELADAALSTDVYSGAGPLRSRDWSAGQVRHVAPLMLPGEAQSFHEDLEAFMEFDNDEFESSFFVNVVKPMYDTWSAWKGKAFEAADQLTLTIRADDWRLAAQDWLTVRGRRRQEQL